MELDHVVGSWSISLIEADMVQMQRWVSQRGWWEWQGNGNGPGAHSPLIPATVTYKKRRRNEAIMRPPILHPMHARTHTHSRARMHAHAGALVCIQPSAVHGDPVGRTAHRGGQYVRLKLRHMPVPTTCAPFLIMVNFPHARIRPGRMRPHHARTAWPHVSSPYTCGLAACDLLLRD